MFKKISSSGQITPGAARLTGFLWGLDGTNDITSATIYDGTDNTGRECVPTNGFEADYKGLNGAVGGVNPLHTMWPTGSGTGTVRYRGSAVLCIRN